MSNGSSNGQPVPEIPKEHQSKGWHMPFSRKKENPENNQSQEHANEFTADKPIPVKHELENAVQDNQLPESQNENIIAPSSDTSPVTPQTNPMKEEKGESNTETPENTGDLAQAIAQTNSFSDTKTVAFYDFSNDTNPVVGWLVCVKGEYIGESFKIVSGRNNIGRSLTNDIALAKEKTVSRERHASIVFEPTRKQFFIQPGESSGLTYLNDELIMNYKPISDRDKIDIGAAKFMFVQLCSDDFSWDDYV